MKIKDIAIMAMMLTFLVVCSKISINIGPIPLTFQVFAVIIISLLLNYKQSIVVIASYIIMGLAGIPVFSNGGGLSYALSPSFGFILGFLIQSIIIPKLKNNNFILTCTNATIRIIIVYIIGLIYMYIIMNYYLDLDKNISYILNVGCYPFILKDILCSIIAAIIYKRIVVIKNSNVLDYAILKGDYMYNKIKQLLVDCANVDEAKIKPESILKDDLGIDSLYAVEMILELETHFDVKIEYEEMQKLVTVNDVVNLINMKEEEKKKYDDK